VKAGQATAAAAVVAQPQHGELVLNPAGSFLFTPAADFNGQDTFTYRLYGDRQPLVFAIEQAASKVRLATTLRIELGQLPGISVDAADSHFSRQRFLRGSLVYIRSGAVFSDCR
jgi:hypothetical protein